MSEHECKVIEGNFGNGDIEEEATPGTTPDNPDKTAEVVELRPTRSELATYIDNATGGIVRELSEYPVADHMREYLEYFLAERITISPTDTPTNFQNARPTITLERRESSSGYGVHIDTPFDAIDRNVRFMRGELGVPMTEDEHTARHWGLDYTLSVALADTIAEIAIAKRSYYVPSIGYKSWFEDLSLIDEELPSEVQKEVGKAQYRRSVLAARVGRGVANQRFLRQLTEYFDGDTEEAQRIVSRYVAGTQARLKWRLEAGAKVSLYELASATPLEKELLDSFFYEL